LTLSDVLFGQNLDYRGWCDYIDSVLKLTIMDEKFEQSTAFEPLMRERSNPISKGEICCLAGSADFSAIRALHKSAGAIAFKTELFSRDNQQQTPLSLALKRGDKQIISLLLSLGKHIPPIFM
jgi:hypothetical protein